MRGAGDATGAAPVTVGALNVTPYSGYERPQPSSAITRPQPQEEYHL